MEYLTHIEPMTLVLILIVLIVAYSAYRLHLNPENDFNILDLIMENGRVSKAASVMMGAFTLTSWLMIQLTLSGKMTEGYFGLYSAAWIAPVVVRLITGNSLSQPPANPPAPPKDAPESTVETVTKTTVATK